MIWNWNFKILIFFMVNKVLRKFFQKKLPIVCNDSFVKSVWRYFYVFLLRSKFYWKLCDNLFIGKLIFNQQTTLENSFTNYPSRIFEIMELWHHYDVITAVDIMLSTGYSSLFLDKTYTAVVFMSFRMSPFIFGVCFSSFIYFSFVCNNKFQHVQVLDFCPCCLFYYN